MTIDTDKLRSELEEAPYLHRSKAIALLDELDRLRAEHDSFEYTLMNEKPAIDRDAIAAARRVGRKGK